MSLVKANLSGVAFRSYINNRTINYGANAEVGFIKGISIGGPTSVDGSDSIGIRHLQTAITRSSVEGSPSSPCLELLYPGMWRFRWIVKPGQRQILVRTKQIRTFSTGSRPTMTVKANSKVGLNTNLTATASISTDWTSIGPITFTSTGTDALWVELRNNLMFTLSPAFFDHITVT